MFTKQRNKRFRYDRADVENSRNIYNVATTYLQLLNKFVYFIFLMAIFDRRKNKLQEVMPSITMEPFVQI